jgi:heterodisulfide reductase subunit A
MMDAGRHPGIEILTGAELLALEGEAGDFHARVVLHPTGVDRARCTACGDCAEVCPVAAPNPFDVGLGTRRAIYRPFPQSVPAAYAIDPELCLNDGRLILCDRCRSACPRAAIDLGQIPRERVLEVGAVVVATGFDEFDPRVLRHYGYGLLPDVVTSLELERLLNASGPTLGHVVRPSDRSGPRRLIYVQCVGARGEGGHFNCSRFCCMNAVKDALLLKQHDPGIESVTILYTDLRAFGKGFEELYARARATDWIRFVRGRPARVREIPGSRDLEVQVEDTETGRPLRLAAEMVVLSCAGRPSADAVALAERLGLPVTASGFLRAGSPDSAVATAREGVFVCGSAGGPQVIPDCVAQGSAAAAEAAVLLRRAGGAAPDAPVPAPASATQAPPEERAAIPEASDEAPRVWASGMAEVAEAFATGHWRDLLGESRAAEAPAAAPAQASPPPEPAPVESAPALDGPPRVGVFLCHCGINIAGVLEMERLRGEAQSLAGVAHAACELFACSSTSQTAIEQAIREQGLNRVVVAACTPRTHEPIFRAACREAGLNPYLLEMVNIRDQCSWVHAADPAAATAKAGDLIRMAVARARLLEPLEPARVPVTPRVLVIGAGLPGMKAAADLRALGFEVVLIERGGETGGLIARLHSLYPDGRAAADAIGRLLGRLREDRVELRLRTEVESVTGFVGNFRARLVPSAGGAAEEIEVGAILVAIGADAYRPDRSDYGYGAAPNVITSVELEALLAKGDFPGVRSVAFVQCVGSRTGGAGRGQAGCSRICCAVTVKQALQLAGRGIETAVFYRDLRPVGTGAEEAYREARGSGVVFLRFSPERPPRVIVEGGRAVGIEVEENLLRVPVRAPADLVVLAVGLVPRAEEARRIRELLKTPQGSDGFFLERHPELGPVETCIDGVVLLGAAQGPKDLNDSLAQAGAAAARVAALLGHGSLELDPAVAAVEAERCRGCGLCASLCEFHAPQIVAGEGGRAAAVVNAALCKGCGTCAVWCPTGAIRARHFTDGQITAMIDQLFEPEAR